MSLGHDLGDARPRAPAGGRRWPPRGSPARCTGSTASSGWALRAARAEVPRLGARAWKPAAAARSVPSALVMHYASFAYALRGDAAAAGSRRWRAARASRGAGDRASCTSSPIRWHRWRHAEYVWAASQRAALLALVRRERGRGRDDRPTGASGCVRAAGCRGAAPAALRPCTRTCRPRAQGVARPSRCWSGLFGYAYEGANGGAGARRAGRAAPDRTADRTGAAGRPRARTPRPASGGCSGARERRRCARRSASAVGCPAQELSDALARCAALLCAASAGSHLAQGDAGGLAGLRATGGRTSTGTLTWRELREQDAARVVRCRAPARWPASSTRLLADTGGAGRARRARARVPRAPHGRRLHGAAAAAAARRLAPAGG